MEERRCKLGLQGRFELVRLIDGAPVVASLAVRQRGRAGVVGVFADALDAAEDLPLGAR